MEVFEDFIKNISARNMILSLKENQGPSRSEKIGSILGGVERYMHILLKCVTAMKI